MATRLLPVELVRKGNSQKSSQKKARSLGCPGAGLKCRSLCKSLLKQQEKKLFYKTISRKKESQANVELLAQFFVVNDISLSAKFTSQYDFLELALRFDRVPVAENQS